MVHVVFDLNSVIAAVGYPGLFLCVFAETGLLLGFFLPGDTLLITAGLLAQRGQLSLWLVLGILVIAAIVGDSTGYAVGKYFGPRLYDRPASRWFRPAHLIRARRFYERHGGKTIIIARFVGYLRTFAPTVAGAVEMPYGRFVAFNIVGGIGWVLSLTLGGYAAGNALVEVEAYLAVLFGGALVLSLSPAAWAVLKSRRDRRLSRQAPAE